MGRPGGDGAEDGGQVGFALQRAKRKQGESAMRTAKGGAEGPVQEVLVGAGRAGSGRMGAAT